MHNGKYPFLEFAKAIFSSFSIISIKPIAALDIFATSGLVLSKVLNVILCVAINLMNPIKSGSTTSAPSLSNKSAT